MDIHIWISIYGFPGIPWVGYLGVGYLGGTDGTLGPMGPGPQGPWASRTPDHKTGYRFYYEVVYRYPARPSIPEFPFHGSYIQFHDRGSLRPRVLEAQVPSVPRSHRSQGPIGPPWYPTPRYPTQGIPGNPYMVWFSGIGIIQWHWNNPMEISIGSNGSFHWIQWNSIGKIGRSVESRPGRPDRAGQPKNRNFFGCSRMIGGLFRVEKRVRLAEQFFF